MNDGRTLGRAAIGEAESTPDLVDQLLDAANAPEPDARVLLLAGVAQSGKSSTLFEFSRRLGTDSFLVSLSEPNTSLFGFVSALAQAMSPVARGAHLSFNALQTRLAGSAPVEHIVTWLRSHVDVNAWIVVDNVEFLADDPKLRELLVGIVGECRRLRWLFAGRTLRSLPLEAWLPYGLAGAPFVTGVEEHAPLSRLLSRVDDNERELLSALAPLRSLEPRVVDGILGDAGTLMLRRLHDRFPGLFETGAPLRLHRDIRDALLDNLRDDGAAGLRGAVERCGDGLEAFEFYDDLLHMYLRMDATDRLADVLARRGLALADDVNVDTLDAALRVVSADSPGVLSLQAVLASRRGHVDVAENLFEKALERASQPLAAQIRYAFGCDLLRRNRADCISIFERLLDESVPGGAHQSEIRSALAQAYVFNEQNGAALEQIKFALHVLPQSATMAAVVKTRAAYVYFYAANNLALAERIASDALAQALQLRSYTVAVGAASIMYNVACERDRPREAIAALSLLADCGIKVGNIAFQSYAVMTMLEYHVEAGDFSAIDESVETLRAFDVAYESLVATEALVAAEAMQRSWKGDFLRAYDLLAPSAARCVGDDYRMLREAQLAFYAAGADRCALSREHLQTAKALMASVDRETHKAVRASILLAIAASAMGDAQAAIAFFKATSETALRYPRLAYVREGALLMHRLWEGEPVDKELRAAFARMRERDAGGFALSFAQFPMPVAIRARAGAADTPIRARYTGRLAYE